MNDFDGIYIHDNESKLFSLTHQLDQTENIDDILFDLRDVILDICNAERVTIFVKDLQNQLYSRVKL